MIEFTWIQSIAPILIFVIAWILVYGAMKKLGVIGTDWILSILALFISLLLISITASVEFTMNIIAYSAVIFVVGFFLILTIAFLTKDIETFKTPLAWTFFGVIIILALFLAFDHFPTFFHMMPGTSNTYLASSAREIKSFIYSKQIVHNFIFTACALIVGFMIVKK